MTRPPLHRLPPLNALRAFEMAGRKGSFRAAADELHITQGAVAQQVRGLEERLGIALFQRLPRGLALTPAGASYLNDVSRAFGILVSATAKLQKRPDTVTISVTPTVATRLLMHRLADLQAALPGVELRTLATEALSDFEHDQVDMAVRLTRPPFPPQLEAAPLFPQELVAVASPHLLRHLTCPLSPDELQTLPAARRAQPLACLPAGTDPLRGHAPRHPPGRPAPPSTRPPWPSTPRSLPKALPSPAGPSWRTIWPPAASCRYQPSPSACRPGTSWSVPAQPPAPQPRPSGTGAWLTLWSLQNALLSSAHLPGHGPHHNTGRKPASRASRRLHPPDCITHPLKQPLARTTGHWCGPLSPGNPPMQTGPEGPVWEEPGSPQRRPGPAGRIRASGQVDHVDDQAFSTAFGSLCIRPTAICSR